MVKKYIKYLVLLKLGKCKLILIMRCYYIFNMMVKIYKLVIFMLVRIWIN